MTQKTAQAKCHPDSVRPPLSGWSSGALWPVRQLQKLKVQRTNRDSVLLRWALDEWLFLPGAGLFAWPWLRYAGCWARSGQSGHWRELNRRQSSYFLLRLSATRVCFQWKSRSCLLSSLPKGTGRTWRGRRPLNLKDRAAGAELWAVVVCLHRCVLGGRETARSRASPPARPSQLLIKRTLQLGSGYLEL